MSVAGRRTVWTACVLAFALAGCAKNTGPIQITIEDDASERMLAARQLAVNAQEEKDPIEAISLYQQAVSLYPDLPAAWNNMGVLLMDEGQYIQASEAFAEAGARAPTDPRPSYNLGLTWERASYMGDAFKHYSAALQRDPRFLPALRGSIRAEALLGTATDATAERIRTALMIEQDADWRDYLLSQKGRVETALLRERGTIGPDRGDDR